MSEPKAKGRLSIAIEVALTLASGSFVFVAITGFLNAYAP